MAIYKNYKIRVIGVNFDQGKQNLVTKKLGQIQGNRDSVRVSRGVQITEFELPGFYYMPS